jgi:hypothetical protein
MQEWRTYAAGGPINSVVHPDSENISQDQTGRITWWSPGQYLVPGALTRIGLRLGAALSVVAGLSLLCCLLGWIQVAKHFGVVPWVTALVVAFIATFRYSTLPFGIYNGGEILLQGLTPWLILAACWVPVTSALRAAGLACLAILIAFFAKLTGLIVASAALFACSVEVLLRLRRITAGMVGGAVGAIVAFGGLEVIWFSKGTTPASGTGFSFRAGDVLFAWGVPWGAGVSWTDMLTSVLSNLRRPVLGIEPEGGHLSLILWLLLPITILFITVLVKGWQEGRRDPDLRRLLKITVIFYAVCATAMSAIFLRGGDVSLEERHLRAAGSLILVCAVAAASHLQRKSVSRLALVAFCALLSLYGCFAFAYRARAEKHAEIDAYSGTYQPNLDESAIAFLKAALAHEGRDSLFVLPSPEAASIFPPSARTLLNHIEFENEAALSARVYRGRVRRGIYVVVPDRLSASAKETLLLKEFVDYPVNGWEKHSLGSSTVFVQRRAGSLNQ